MGTFRRFISFGMIGVFMFGLAPVSFAVDAGMENAMRSALGENIDLQSLLGESANETDMTLPYEQIRERVLDNNDAGFRQSKNWTHVPLAGYRGDFLYTAPTKDILEPQPIITEPIRVPIQPLGVMRKPLEPVVQESDSELVPLPRPIGANASWTFQDITPGRYAVYATWVPLPKLATDATYSVTSACTSGVCSAELVRVNQQLEPGYNNDSGDIRPVYMMQTEEPMQENLYKVKWHKLSTISATNSITVSISSSVRGYVVADAIRLVRLPDSADLSISGLLEMESSIPERDIISKSKVRYHLYPKNIGPSVAKNATVIVRVPENLRFDPEGTSPLCSAFGNEYVVCRIGDMIPYIFDGPVPGEPIPLPYGGKVMQASEDLVLKKNDEGDSVDHVIQPFPYPMNVLPIAFKVVSYRCPNDEGGYVLSAFIFSDTQDPNFNNNSAEAVVRTMCYFEEPLPPFEPPFKPMPIDCEVSDENEIGCPVYFDEPMEEDFIEEREELIEVEEEVVSQMRKSEEAKPAKEMKFSRR